MLIPFRFPLLLGYLLTGLLFSTHLSGLAAEDHPYAKQIRAVEGRIFDVAQRTGTDNLAMMQSDLLIVAARDFYHARRLPMTASETAPPTRDRGNEGLNPQVHWNLRPLASLADIEALQQSVANQLEKSNNPDVETELEKMRDKLVVLHDELTKRIDEEVSQRAKMAEVSDVLFANGVDSFGKLGQRAQAAEGRLAGLSAPERERARQDALTIWTEADRLVQAPVKEQTLERCRKGLERHNREGGEHGILLVRRTHLMGPPNWAKDMSAAKMEVGVLDDTVRVYRGDRKTIEGLIEAYQGQATFQQSGSWRWGRNPAAAPVLEQVTYDWTVSWVETAVRAEELTRGILVLNKTFDTAWPGPLAGLGKEVDMPQEVAK